MRQTILTILLALCALAGTAQAAATFQEGVAILGRYYDYQGHYVIASTNMRDQYLTQMKHKIFENENFNIGSSDVPITMTINGTIRLAEGSTLTDVTVSSSVFTITFTSTTNYFTNASVTKNDETAVSGCTVSGKKSKTLTITIPEDTSFGRIVLTLATHTPLDFCTIGGIEDSYIDDGVNQPVPTVTLDGQTLQQDVDYTLSWSQGTSTGSVTVTGAGDYIGQNYKRYNLREPNLSDFRQLNDGAYEIASQRDLDYLARIVNGKGENASCAGITFRQTKDIDYSYTTDWDYTESFDSNFTPIGGYGKSFNGTYDGDGHTISGIRVYADGNGNSASSKGLFGYISGNGTVKNVVLMDANFYGCQNIGGLVGFIDSNGSVTDCYLYHVRVHSTDSNDSKSIIVGNNGGTVTRTHYRDCCEYYLTYSNTTPPYNNYLSSVFTLTPDANVVLPARTGGSVVNASLTTYADGLTLSGTQYYTEGTEIALTYNGTVPTGQWPRFTAITANNEDKTAELIDGWTRPTNRITVTSSAFAYYCPNLLVIRDQTLWDGSGTYTSIINNFNDELNGKTLMPCITSATAPGGTAILYDNDAAISTAGGLSNAERIAALADGQTHDVMLMGRTLYRDGKWNTLCLPFAVSGSDIKGNEDNPLHGATIREFDTFKWYDSNGKAYALVDGIYLDPSTIAKANPQPTTVHRSGQVDDDGRLYLYFEELNSPTGRSDNLIAGLPYIVKWSTPEATNIVNPVFQGVTVSSTAPVEKQTSDEGYDPVNKPESLGNVTFRGTFAPIDYDADNHSILYLGTQNKLYYPQADAHIGAFRARFLLDNGLACGESSSQVRGISLNLGNGEGTQTGIGHTEDDGKHQSSTEITDKAGAWYSINGVRIDAKPTRKGLYIHGGRKVAIK